MTATLTRGLPKYFGDVDTRRQFRDAGPVKVYTSGGEQICLAGFCKWPHPFAFPAQVLVEGALKPPLEHWVRMATKEEMEQTHNMWHRPAPFKPVAPHEK